MPVLSAVVVVVVDMVLRYLVMYNDRSCCVVDVKSVVSMYDVVSIKS